MILLREEGRNKIKKRKKGSNLRERDGGSCIETRNSQPRRRSKREQDGKETLKWEKEKGYAKLIGDENEDPEEE